MGDPVGVPDARGSWIFSADDHLLEGTDTFARRVPARFAEAAPRIIDHHGGDAWLIDDAIVPITSVDGLASWPDGERPLLSTRVRGNPSIGGSWGDDPGR